MVPFLLLQRVKLCLLITYLFAYYLVFLIYWEDFIATAGSMAVLYALSGLAIVVLFVAASFSEQANMRKSQGVYESSALDSKLVQFLRQCTKLLIKSLA